MCYDLSLVREKIRSVTELMAMAGSDREPSPDAAGSKQPEDKCGPDASCQCQPSAAETREFRKVRERLWTEEAGGRQTYRQQELTTT